MSNYTKTTDFEAKDSLPSGDSGKIIRGSEFETEFDNIATAIATKADAASPTFTGTVTIDGLTVNGNTTLGNAATDTVTVTADIASNLIPSADDTYNLGASGAEWNDLYVDGVAYIDTIDGFATTGNITFGDSDKAIFGAGSDLQIYHDGSNSYISDEGTGQLILKGSGNIFLRSATDENYLKTTVNGSVELYHDNAEKLATTSTGVDVTGTVTADGVNTDYTNGFKIFDGSQLDASWTHNNTTGTSTLNVGRNATWGGELIIQTDTKDRANFASNGDISFYEDTGVTAKFFWDASTERLGLGTTSPSATLDVDGTLDIAPSSGDAQLKILNSANTGRSLIYFSDPAGTGGRMVYNHASDYMAFETNGTSEAMRIDSSGNLGIGTSSPNTNLEIADSSGAELRLTNTTTSMTQGGLIGALEFYSSDTSGINPSVAASVKAVASSGGGAYGELVFNTIPGATEGADATESMRIDDSGNVGIGTSAPNAPLEISTAGTTAPRITSSDGLGDAVQRFYSGSTYKGQIGWDQSSDNLGLFGSGGSGVPNIVIDSAGNVGIGTSSPASDLHIHTAGGAGNIQITGGASGLTSSDGTHLVHAVDNLFSITNKESAALTLGTSNTERVRIDASGNVGIGTTSNISGNSKLQVLGNGMTVSDNVTAATAKNSRYFGVSHGNREVTMMYLACSAADSNALILGGGTSLGEPATEIAFRTGSAGTKGAGSERARLTNGGHLLVGKTSQDQTDIVGVELKDDGLVVATTDGAQALTLNRKTSDGSILQFRKDNSTVGNINSTGSGSTISIGGGSSGVYMGTNGVYPTDGSGTLADNSRDLGAGAYRFKDLYLSGGAYLGGTAAANKLDDYEEGTWTPTVSGVNGLTVGASPSYSATYTKIGRLVHFTVKLDFDSTDTVDAGDRVLVSNLPFTRDTAIETITGVGTAVIYSSYGSNVLAQGTVGIDSSTVISVVITNVSGSLTHASGTRLSGTYIAA